MSHLLAAAIASSVATDAIALNESAALRTDHLSTRLIAEQTAAVAGKSLRIALRLEHDPHWHTYWRNPGDSGLPTRIDLELPAGVTAGEIEWPAPFRFDIEGIVNFGYSDTMLLPITLSVDSGFSASSLEVKARASWLVCEVECIPGSGNYELRVPVANTSKPDSRWVEDFAAVTSRQPVALQASTALTHAADRVSVEIREADLPPDVAAWEVFPVNPQIIVNGAFPMWSRIEGGLRMTFPQSEFFAGLPPSLSLLLVKDDRALLIDAPVTPRP